MAGRVVITADVTGSPVAAERDAAAAARGYLRYLSCGWPRTGSCRPVPSGTRVRSYDEYVLPSVHQLPPPWVRFGLYRLAAGLLVGFLVQFAFLALGLVRLISGRIKGPCTSYRRGVAANRSRRAVSNPRRINPDRFRAGDGWLRPGRMANPNVPFCAGTSSASHLTRLPRDLRCRRGDGAAVQAPAQVAA